MVIPPDEFVNRLNSIKRNSDSDVRVHGVIDKDVMDSRFLLSRSDSRLDLETEILVEVVGEEILQVPK